MAPLCKDIDLWSTEYIQQLPTEPHSTRNPVLEFTRSTGLLPIIEALGGEDTSKAQTYLSEYNQLLNEEFKPIHIKNKYHVEGHLVTLMPFKRFFMICKL